MAHIVLYSLTQLDHVPLLPASLNDHGSHMYWLREMSEVHWIVDLLGDK